MRQHDDAVILSGTGTDDTFEAILNRRISRRDFLKTNGITVAAAAVAQTGAKSAQAAMPQAATGRVVAGVPFKAIKPVVSSSARPVVAGGHKMSVLIRWGDPLFKDAPAFDPKKLTAAAQEKQFGYKCDFVGFSFKET
jgi:hypothetical protein